MAEAHIERLRKVATCPVCGAGRLRTHFTLDNSSIQLDFLCGAIFRANLQHDIVSDGTCSAKTKVAVDLLNKEAKGAAS